MVTEKEFREFLSRYIGRDVEAEKRLRVTQKAIDGLVLFARYDKVEQDIIDYGTEHPEAPFWDLLRFIKPGLKDVTEEELLEDDDQEE